MTTTVLTHRYRPRGAALSLLRCRDAEVLLSGPAGTGKTRACLEKLHLMALQNAGMRGLIVRKTLASLGSTALVTWREQVVPEAMQTGEVQFYGGSAEEPPQYRYANGSRIILGGLDKPTRIMSSEYDVVYVQEAIELVENDWEALITRLRHGKVSFQQLIADTNPDKPTHWLKLRCDRNQTRVFESRHEDNPLLYDEPEPGRFELTSVGAAYMTKLDGLTGVRHQRLRRGLWVAAEGIIYEGYDPAVHLIDRFDIPAEWTRWWVVDFGFTNPFVMQWWAEDPDGRLYRYREIYHSRRLVEDHAKTILAQVKDGDGNWLEPKPRAIICDHDAEDRATLERHLGMSTAAAHKSVSDGIQAFAARLKATEDGKPRLFFLRDSLVERDQDLADAGKPTCTEEEITGYIWDIGAGKAVKEVPLKVDDHGMDTGRYVVAELDVVGAFREGSFAGAMPLTSVDLTRGLAPGQTGWGR